MVQASSIQHHSGSVKVDVSSLILELSASTLPASSMMLEKLIHLQLIETLFV
jgi:hypothetical protein